jgi:putative tricarboxylic transport membrane protein
MRRPDRIVGLVWLALGIGIAVGAVDLGLGELHMPGIGFMPFLVGASLGVSGLILLIAATAKGKGSERIWQGQRWQNVVTPVSALLAYVFLMEPLGFLLSSFFLMFLLFKIAAPGKFLASLVSSAAVVFLSYMVFFVWLKVTLPKGFLGLG